MENNDHKTGSKGGTRRRFALAAIGPTATAVLTLGAATPALASPSASRAPPAVGRADRDHPAAGRCRRCRWRVQRRPRAGWAERQGQQRTVGSERLYAGTQHNLPDRRDREAGPVRARVLVVVLSTTPTAAGGPNANLAGVFQLTDVASSHGLTQVFADWEVAKAGAFGNNVKTTLTAYLGQGHGAGNGDQLSEANLKRRQGDVHDRRLIRRTTRTLAGPSATSLLHQKVSRATHAFESWLALSSASSSPAARHGARCA